MNAKYPPTTGRGRNDTAFAQLNRPISINKSPKLAVAIPNVTMVVEMISWMVPCSLNIRSAMKLLIQLKNKSPASWTSAFANEMDDTMTNIN